MDKCHGKKSSFLRYARVFQFKFRYKYIIAENVSFKEMTALNEGRKTCSKVKINSMIKEHESNVKALKASYKERLVYEDKKYLTMEKEISGKRMEFDR